MEPSNPLFTTTISTAVGGAVALITVFLTNLGHRSRQNAQLESDRRRRREDVLRDRGEELYGLIDVWAGALIGHYLNLNYVMQGKIDYNQFHDLEIKQLSGNRPNLGRIEMLIDVYFPDSRGAYDDVIKQRTAANAIATRHKWEYESTGPGMSALLDDFIAAQIAFEKSVDVLKKNVIELVRAV